jgi:hypothetical protein
MLPCWWGITPGVTTIQETERILRPLAPYIRYPSLSVILDYQVGEVTIVLDVAFSPPGPNPVAPPDPAAKIELIEVHTLAIENDRGAYGSREYRRLFHAYEAPLILAEYGQPAQAILDVETNQGEPYGGASLETMILYPDSGAIVEYVNSAQIVGDYLRGCLSGAFVRMWLMPVARQDIFEQTLSSFTEDSYSHESYPWNGLVPSAPWLKTIEEATGITPPSFYEQFRDGGGRNCLETYLPSWPFR